MWLRWLAIQVPVMERRNVEWDGDRGDNAPRRQMHWRLKVVSWQGVWKSKKLCAAQYCAAWQVHSRTVQDDTCFLDHSVAVFAWKQKCIMQVSGIVRSLLICGCRDELPPYSRRFWECAFDTMRTKVMVKLLTLPSSGTSGWLPVQYCRPEFCAGVGQGAKVNKTKTSCKSTLWPFFYNVTAVRVLKGKKEFEHSCDCISFAHARNTSKYLVKTIHVAMIYKICYTWRFCLVCLNSRWHSLFPDVACNIVLYRTCHKSKKNTT